MSACARGVRDINVEPFEDVTEPRPAGREYEGPSSAFGVALPAGRGSVFVRTYMPSTFMSHNQHHTRDRRTGCYDGVVPGMTISGRKQAA